MRYRGAVLSVGVLGIAGSAPTFAQLPGATVDTARAAVLAHLPRGAWVRLTSGDTTVSGVFRRMDQGMVVLAGGPRGEQAIAAAAIRTLWVVRGRETSAGARGGALGGGGLGLAVGALAGGFGCESGNCGRARSEGAVLGLMAGAAVGALVGAGVGTLVPRWRQLFP